eukprot:CAMPEP_0201869350 /NCGR_PEP_ID=MMETSP0902-20130614/2899_1 /ASSEMBLY_ACC=CAM_ASM_000551 /TAXON_ID=420261 /ORGANISM="Thalassiosira antarctica, Strain CCMP982" /LENGTH=162 /DNA_ID=CAMNT_0048394843 /DNA_START=236 /DNA_END=722 /DNA_ORIENTATION=-
MPTNHCCNHTTPQTRAANPTPAQENSHWPRALSQPIAVKAPKEKSKALQFTAMSRTPRTPVKLTHRWQIIIPPGIRWRSRCVGVMVTLGPIRGNELARRSHCVGMMVTLGPIHGNELARRLHHVGVLAPLSSPTTSLAVLGLDERRRCPRDAVGERRDELFR